MTKTFYLILAVVGTIVPYAFLIQFARANGLDVGLFVEQLMGNPASAMFTADLLISSLVFWVFLFREGGRLQMPRLWLYVVLNLLVGLSLALPLFLYYREEALARRPSLATD